MIKNLSQKIKDDIKGYQFQHEAWTCWITCIKNIFTTMKRHYNKCPNPSIHKLHKIVKAKYGFIPNYNVVTTLINEKILANSTFILREKTNSNMKEFKQIVDNNFMSPVIFSVSSNDYFKELNRKYNYHQTGYVTEGISKLDHTLIAFDIDEDIIFFDPFVPHLRLFGKHSPEKAMFKLSNIIMNRLWLNAKIPNWIMWLEKPTAQTTLSMEFKK